ncbi:hypothetical protein ACFOD1_07825 [Pseudidiomarina halophila]|uniref:Uncharacterized protein n=1 Tax=Pseudidiomarina halophila TaxID=1449799 RepID=A0A432XRL0_9GAMM|nr:hypothetical protein [Pseudidiomarina halophila]RUO51369.1 hypothetical protein CWI69_11830 [Pseudidiomarina halophila]
MIKQHGQALIESIAVIVLLALLMSLLKDVIHPTNIAQQQRIDESRKLIWRVASHVQLQHTDEYAFARRARTVLAPLTQLTELDLSNENLRQLKADDNYVAMARITDAWQPRQSKDLSQRPQFLTPLAKLNELGMPQLQRLLSWLHFTEEFAPEQLRWGYVDVDATPAEITCTRQQGCR